MPVCVLGRGGTIWIMVSRPPPRGANGYRYATHDFPILRWLQSPGEVDAVVLGDGHPYLLHRARIALGETQALQAHLAAIVESSEDAIMSMTLDGTIVSWNPAAEGIFGYTASEIIGKSAYVLSPPDLLEEEEDLLETISNGERIIDLETTRLRKDGKRISVSISMSPLRHRDGKLIGISKIARDITESKLAAEKFSQLEHRYRRLKKQVLELGWIAEDRVLPDSHWDWSPSCKVKANKPGIALCEQQGLLHETATADHEKLTSILRQMREIGDSVRPGA